MCLSSSLHWDIFYNLNYRQKIMFCVFVFICLFYMVLYFSRANVVRLHLQYIFYNLNHHQKNNLFYAFQSLSAHA